MPKHIDKGTKLATAHQIVDHDLIDNESSSEDSVSLESYLNTYDEAEEKVFSDTAPEGSNPKNKGPVDSVKLRNHVGAPVEKGTKGSYRESRKRRTLDEYLSKGGTGNDYEGGAQKDSNRIDSTSKNSEQVADKVKTSAAQASAEKSMEAEFKCMFESEAKNCDDLVELFEAKASIQNSLGKHACSDSFAILIELNGVQGCVLSHLDNICNKNVLTIEDLISKLCERQKLLSKYAQLVMPRMSNFTVKLQSKAPSSCQRHVELLQKPVSWMQQTIGNVERLKECVKPDNPNYEIITVAQEELLDISNDLAPVGRAKEPLKYSVLVELRNPPNGERKLMSIFLFDNVLVCARQRVIVLRKHFTQDSDSDTASVSTSAKDQSDLIMNTRTISRYEVKWFIPLEQLDSLDSKGIAFDEENLLERLQLIETLKGKIVKVRQELQEETSKLDKESKRQKLRIPKIHRLRSYLYDLQADLVLQTPKLPLFISATDGQRYCLLMASEKERITWESAIMRAKARCRSVPRRQSPALVSKRDSLMRPFSTTFRESRRAVNARRSSVESETSAQEEILKNELSYMINHCKTAVPLNKLGKVIISGNAVSGILEVCVHEIGGLTEPGPYYVAIEVDFYGLFELVAKTKSISDITNPRWDQTFMFEIETSQTICFTVFRQSIVFGQVELPLEEDQLDQAKVSHRLKTDETVSKPVYLQISILYNERKKLNVRPRSKKQSEVFGQSLEEVLKRDQADRERLKKQIGGTKNCEELRVPVLVTACVEEIERRGLQEEGIYRISGAVTTVSRLQDLFDRDTSLAVKQIGDYDIHVISSLLKLFFRELPEPIIPTNIFSDLIKATAPSDERKLEEIGHILRKMPRVNLDTFQYLMDHLIRVCQYESDNKMNLGNLSVIWAMTLFQPANMPAPPQIPSPTAETSDAKCAPPQSVQSATSASMLQTMVLGTIFDAYANGKLDLPTHRSVF
ncbi:Active breakpoint cluster region-related protein [Taenia crassiceps]|uniref:Active breakpoint cluster region-related protein n=1 Tax=Taenia crassiceps TaxID=6207 RepID=A0ABR4QJH3_9CEST